MEDEIVPGNGFLIPREVLKREIKLRWRDEYCAEHDDRQEYYAYERREHHHQQLLTRRRLSRQRLGLDFFT